MSLDAKARRRYARQLLLAEIGEVGQERLIASGFRGTADCEADAYAVAADYLERAGCFGNDEGAEVRVPPASEVMRFAGNASLRESAALVLGAYSAVEHLKRVLGIAPAHEVPTDLTLS